MNSTQTSSSKRQLRIFCDLVAKEEFAVDAETWCLDVEDAMVREVAVQCLAKVAPKSDDCLILALAARKKDSSFPVRAGVGQVWPAVAEKGDPLAVPTKTNVLEHEELDVTKVGTSGPKESLSSANHRNGMAYVHWRPQACRLKCAPSAPGNDPGWKTNSCLAALRNPPKDLNPAFQMAALVAQRMHDPSPVGQDEMFAPTSTIHRRPPQVPGQ